MCRRCCPGPRRRTWSNRGSRIWGTHSQPQRRSGTGGNAPYHQTRTSRLGSGCNDARRSRTGSARAHTPRSDRCAAGWRSALLHKAGRSTQPHPPGTCRDRMGTGGRTVACACPGTFPRGRFGTLGPAAPSRLLRCTCLLGTRYRRMLLHACAGPSFGPWGRGGSWPAALWPGTYLARRQCTPYLGTRSARTCLAHMSRIRTRCGQVRTHAPVRACNGRLCTLIAPARRCMCPQGSAGSLSAGGTLWSSR